MEYTIFLIGQLTCDEKKTRLQLLQEHNSLLIKKRNKIMSQHCNMFVPHKFFECFENKQLHFHF